MLDVEFACALSHIKACRMVVNRNIPYALVLEDDAIPNPDLPEDISGHRYEDADLTSLYYGKTHVRGRSEKTLFRRYRSYSVFTGSKVCGATGYIVSLSGARHIATNSLPATREADWPTCTERFKRERRWRVVFPRLVNHPDLGCDDSIIADHGRWVGRKRPRLFGILVPPIRHAARSWILATCRPMLGLRRIQDHKPRPKRS